MPKQKNRTEATDEQKAWFKKHFLVCPNNKMTAEVIIDFINQDAEQRAWRLQTLQLLHATVIGLELDDGKIVTYVRIKSIRERMAEGHIARKCPFLAQLKTNEGNMSKSLSNCYKNDAPLWRIQSSPSSLPKIDWDGYSKHKSQIILLVCERLKRLDPNIRWRFSRFGGSEWFGDIALQFLGEKAPRDNDLVLLGDAIGTMEKPSGIGLSQVYVDAEGGFVYYRIRVDITPFRQ